MPVNLRVLAVFDRACDLVTPGGQVVALVTPDIGDGPFNIVVEAHVGEWSSIEPGTPAQIQASVLRLSGMQITLAQAIAWEPRPDWDTLRNHQSIVARRLPRLEEIAALHSPASLAMNHPIGPSAAQAHVQVSPGVLAHAVQQALQALQAGWDGDVVQLRLGATRLAGLGNGLTPTGDDLLIGMMLCAWIAHPTPEAFCCEVVQAAAPRTTTLSAAFLRSAAKGECSAAWHQLLAALTRQDNDLTPSVRQVLAHGATSGADTLAGFIYAAYLAGDLSNERLQPGAQK